MTIHERDIGGGATQTVERFENGYALVTVVSADGAAERGVVKVTGPGPYDYELADVEVPEPVTAAKVKAL